MVGLIFRGARQSAALPLASCGIVAFHHTSRGTDNHAMIRELTANDRIGTNYTALTKDGSGLDTHANTEEAVLADAGRADFVRLLEHRDIDVLKRVLSIGDKYVAGNQATATYMQLAAGDDMKALPNGYVVVNKQPSAAMALRTQPRKNSHALPNVHILGIHEKYRRTDVAWHGEPSKEDFVDPPPHQPSQLEKTMHTYTL